MEGGGVCCLWRYWIVLTWQTGGMGWVKFKIAQLGCKLKWVRVEKKVILSNLGICLVKRVMFATQLKVIFSFLESEYVYV